MLTPVVGFANDYTFVEYLRGSSYVLSSLNTTKISIIITHYKRIAELLLCLEALTKQNINPKNFEVIVSDDGSLLSVEDKEKLFSLKNNFESFFIIESPNDGFRLSRARNLGIRLSKNPYCLVLDCDLIPCVDMVSNHLRNVLVSDKVVSIGFRYASSNIQNFEDILKYEGSIEDLDWRYERYFKESLTWSKLTSRAWLFLSGGNFMMSSKKLKEFEFDEDFVFWGGEDNELGYRLCKEGFYLIPEFNARSHHVSLGGVNSSKKQDNSEMRKLLESKCPSITPLTMKDKSSSIPFVSFWITNFNKNKYLRKAIESCVNTSFSYEIVLVDNGSEVEGTDLLLKELDSEFDKLRLFTEKKKGAYYTFQKALKESKGEILVQIDGDDFIDVSIVDEMIYTLYISPLGLLFGNHKKVDKEGNLINEKIWRFPRCTREDNIFVGMHVRNTRVFRKRDLSRSPKREYTLGAVDYSLYSKLMLVSYASFLDKTSYFYRQLEDSISNSQLSEQMSDTLFVLDENLSMLDFYENVEVQEILKRSISVELKGITSFTKHLNLPKELHEFLLDTLKNKNFDSVIDSTVLDIDESQKLISLGGEINIYLDSYKHCLSLLKHCFVEKKDLKPLLLDNYLIDLGF